MKKPFAAAVLQALAPVFNRILGIEPGHFRSAPSGPKAGAGTARRKAREAAYRKQQAERLKHADNARIPAVLTRQLRRQQQRLAAKGRALI